MCELSTRSKRTGQNQTWHNHAKSECVNKIIRRSLPNRVTFRKNFHGRAQSAVHAANHGPGESIMALCLSVGSPITQGSKVHKSLKQEQNVYEKNKQYQKSDKRKGKRKEKSDKMYELFLNIKRKSSTAKVRKNKVAESPNKAAKSDHDYIKKQCCARK